MATDNKDWKAICESLHQNLEGLSAKKYKALEDADRILGSEYADAPGADHSGWLKSVDSARAAHKASKEAAQLATGYLCDTYRPRRPESE